MPELYTRWLVCVAEVGGTQNVGSPHHWSWTHFLSWRLHPHRILSSGLLNCRNENEQQKYQRTFQGQIVTSPRGLLGGVHKVVFCRWGSVWVFDGDGGGEQEKKLDVRARGSRSGEDFGMMACRLDDRLRSVDCLWLQIVFGFPVKSMAILYSFDLLWAMESDACLQSSTIFTGTGLRVAALGNSPYRDKNSSTSHATHPAVASPNKYENFQGETLVGTQEYVQRLKRIQEKAAVEGPYGPVLIANSDPIELRYK
ncbi:hypothetical protein K438DRAFT_1772141 [Mycena galopus ATCC 62051]|nr:hypothetical protein K438DRAFT_1772141 [Mycena galopus ATCC 62051]